LLEVLATRVAVPLAPASAALARSMRRLAPILKFEGKEFLMLTPQVAGIPAASLVPLREIWHLTGIRSLPRLISCCQESKSNVERAMGIEPTGKARPDLF
jgi:hypothetical protein